MKRANLFVDHDKKKEAKKKLSTISWLIGIEK